MQKGFGEKRQHGALTQRMADGLVHEPVDGRGGQPGGQGKTAGRLAGEKHHRAHEFAGFPADAPLKPPQKEESRSVCRPCVTSRRC